MRASTMDDLERADKRVVSVLSRIAIPTLRWSLAITYIWFGALKLFGVSPVEGLVKKMAMGIPRSAFVKLMGVWEVGLGIALLFRLALPLTLALYAAQLAGTFLVFLLQPREAFHRGNPLRLTYTGEFILKNLVLLAAGLTLAGTVGSDREKVHNPESDEATIPSEALLR